MDFVYVAQMESMNPLFCQHNKYTRDPWKKWVIFSLICRVSLFFLRKRPSKSLIIFFYLLNFLLNLTVLYSFRGHGIYYGDSNSLILDKRGKRRASDPLELIEWTSGFNSKAIYISVSPGELYVASVERLLPRIFSK